MVKTLFLTVQESGFTLMGLYPWVWDIACELTQKLGYAPSENEIVVSLVFLGLTTAQDTVLSLPWALYSTFVVEEKHGFNKTTPLLFVTDTLTTLALTVAIGAPVMAALLKIIKWGGEYFYVYVWGFLLVFSIFFLTIFPIFIQPL
jgi:STE24 endopeptidase